MHNNMRKGKNQVFPGGWKNRFYRGKVLRREHYKCCLFYYFKVLMLKGGSNGKER